MTRLLDKAHSDGQGSLSFRQGGFPIMSETGPTQAIGIGAAIGGGGVALASLLVSTPSALFSDLTGLTGAPAVAAIAALFVVLTALAAVASTKLPKAWRSVGLFGVCVLLGLVAGAFLDFGTRLEKGGLRLPGDVGLAILAGGLFILMGAAMGVGLVSPEHCD
jgi:hypothetical protein